MPNFNLDEYKPVKERKASFYKDYPDGRIVVEQINLPEQILECAEFKAYTYKNREDQEKGLPFSTGHALEIRDMELSISKRGEEYESVNYTSWTENAEESAIGRALDNAGYAGAPSREEMKKVIRHSEILKKIPTPVVGPQKPQQTETKKPSTAQIKAVAKVAAYKGEISANSMEEAKDLMKEVSDWDASTASEYISRRLTLDEARVKEGLKDLISEGGEQ